MFTVGIFTSGCQQWLLCICLRKICYLNKYASITKGNGKSTLTAYNPNWLLFSLYYTIFWFSKPLVGVNKTTHYHTNVFEFFFLSSSRLFIVFDLIISVLNPVLDIHRPNFYVSTIAILRRDIRFFAHCILI